MPNESDPNIPTLDEMDQDANTGAGGGSDGTLWPTEPPAPDPAKDPNAPPGGWDPSLTVDIVDIGDIGATPEEVIQAIQIRAAIKAIERLENVPKNLAQKRSYAKALQVVASIAPDALTKAQALIEQFD